jgi:SWI/SNF-related matrix-associated actin-dependent regulator of chromatin subfamily A3
VTIFWGNSITLAQLRYVQIRINSIQSKDLKLLEELGRDKDVLASLDLIFGQDRCDLQFKGINVATMNSKSQRALHQLMSLVSKESVRYEALVPRAEFKQKLEAAAQPLNPDRSKLICSMDVQIFGARYLADTIAKELCKYRMFLQHPIRRPLDVAYENPQYLSAVGSSFTNGAVLPPISAEASQNDTELKPNIEEPDHDPDDLKVFINNLPGHDYLREADVDKRIETNLLRQVYRSEGDFGEILIDTEATKK